MSLTSRIFLTPKDTVLVGKYPPSASNIHVVCNTSDAAFSVDLPCIGSGQNQAFVFHNFPKTGSGYSIAVNGRLINYKYRTYTVNAGDTVIFVDSLDGNWLAYSISGSIGTPLIIGNATDNTTIESDGTIKLNGAATTFEDLNFAIVRSGGPVATRPDDVTINNVYHKEFTSANNQSCGDTAEIYHAALLGQTLHPHYHCFLKGGESSGTTGATFRIYWELRQSTVTTSSYVDLNVTSAQLAANANKIDVYDLTGFAGPSELGAQLALSLHRTAGNAGDVIVETYGVHVEFDSTGSRTALTK